MGLFGGGNSQSNTTVQNYQGTNTPQVDVSGAAGSSALIVSPQALGGSVGPINANSYNAPVYLTALEAAGDSAVQSAASVAKASIAAASPAPTDFLSSLFTGTNLYWVIGAVVVLMFARRHHG